MVKKRGFTLIELIIVIAACGVLLGTSAIYGARQVRIRARETQVRADIRSLSNSLSIYASMHNGKYPKSNGNGRYFEILYPNTGLPTNLNPDDFTPEQKIGNSYTVQRLRNNKIFDKIPTNPIYENADRYYLYGSDGDTFQIFSRLTSRPEYIYEGTPQKLTDKHIEDPAITRFTAKVYDRNNVQIGPDVEGNAAATPPQINVDIAGGDYLKVIWHAENAVFCEAQDDWRGTADPSFEALAYDSTDFKNFDSPAGGETIPNAVLHSGTYTLSCPGLTKGIAPNERLESQYVHKSFVVNNAPVLPPGPSVAFYFNGGLASNRTIDAYKDIANPISWSPTNIDKECRATNDWHGTTVRNGDLLEHVYPGSSTDATYLAGDIGQVFTYGIKCTTSAGGEATDTFNVNVIDSSDPTADLYLSKDNGTTYSPDDMIISKGSTAVLKWETKNVIGCTAEMDWNDEIKSADLALGTVVKGPINEDQTYRINCTGFGGKTATDTIKLNTTDLPTVSLYANIDKKAISVFTESDFYLTWSSGSATSCTASGAGSSTPVDNFHKAWNGEQSLNDAFSGPYSEASAGTYTYKLTCENAAGSTASDQVTINVQNPPIPTLDIQANGSQGPITVSTNTMFTLSWLGTDILPPASCTATGSWSGSKAQDSSEIRSIVSPGTYTYTLSCPGFVSEPATDSVTVIAVNLPSVSINIDGFSSIAAFTGVTYNLNWYSSNSTACTASGNGWSGNKALNGGPVPYIQTVANTYNYTITCRNAAGQTATATATVVVSIPPTPTVEIRADGFHTQITKPIDSDVMLTWSSFNTVACIASVDWSGNKALNGSQSMTLSQAKIYNSTMTCIGYGNAPNAVDIALVKVEIIPTVDLYIDTEKGPISKYKDSTVELSWTSNKAQSCNATGDWSGGKGLTGTFTTTALTAIKTYTYTLTCTSSTGNTAEDTVSVVITFPPAPTANLLVRPNGGSVSDGPINIGLSDYFTLFWTSTDALACTASGDWNDTIGLNSDTLGIVKGPMGTLGDYTYTITCEGYSGQTKSDSVIVHVLNKPTVNLLVEGEKDHHVYERTAFNLSWALSEDVKRCEASSNPAGYWFGDKPFTVYYIFGPSWPPDVFGGESLKISTLGAYNFTLTCYNAANVSASDTVTVHVDPDINPWVDIKANGSDGPISVVVGTPVTLSWTSRNVTPPLYASWNWSDSDWAQGGRIVPSPEGSETYIASNDGTQPVTYQIYDENGDYDQVDVQVVSACDSISDLTMELHDNYAKASWKSSVPAHGFFYYKRSDLPDIPSNWGKVEFGNINPDTPDYNPSVTIYGLSPDATYDYYINDPTCSSNTFHTKTEAEECADNYYGLTITGSPTDTDKPRAAFEWSPGSGYGDLPGAQPNTIAGKVEPGSFGPWGNHSCPAITYPLSSATVVYHVIDNVGGNPLEKVYGETTIALDSKNEGIFHLPNMDKTLFGPTAFDEIFVKKVVTRSGITISGRKYVGDKYVENNGIAQKDYNYGTFHVYKMGEVAYNNAIPDWVELYPDGERKKFPGSFHINFNETFYVSNSFNSLGFTPAACSVEGDRCTAAHYNGSGPTILTTYPWASPGWGVEMSPWYFATMTPFYIDAKSDGTGFYNQKRVSDFDLATPLAFYSYWDGYTRYWDPTVVGGGIIMPSKCYFDRDVSCTDDAGLLRRRYFHIGDGNDGENCFYRDDSRGWTTLDIGHGGTLWPNFYGYYTSNCTNPTP